MAERAMLARDDFTEFCRFTMPKPGAHDDPLATIMEEARHQELLDQLIMAMERGEILYAVVTMPPRHGKSERVSRRLPPWVVGRHPDSQIIFTTYGQEFADEFGQKWREIMQGERYKMIFPHVRLKTDTKAKDKLGIADYDGLMVAVGMGGSVTGRGAHWFIVDDPIKNLKQASSAIIRKDQWEWYQSVLLTRLMPGARILIVLTRWSEDDIVGRLFNELYIPKEEQEKWYKLHLPAIDHEGTDHEEALWPDRYDLTYLRSVRRVSGTRVWNALWQGRPTPPEGAFFKSDQIFEYGPEEMPDVYRAYVTGDMALGTLKENDETVVGTWMVDSKGFAYLHPDLFVARKKSDECVDEIIEYLRRHLDNLMLMWWEKGQIEKAVGPFLFKRMREKKLSGVSVLSLPCSTDKGVRAAPMRGRMQLGMVRFPRWAPWWPRMKDQMLKFTGSGEDPEDDFVDMCSLLGQGLGWQQEAVDPMPRDSNVIPFTMGAIKRETAEADRRAKIEAMLRGM